MNSPRHSCVKRDIVWDIKILLILDSSSDNKSERGQNISEMNISLYVVFSISSMSTCYLLRLKNVSAVCIYKGNQYTQSQRWQDGCDFNCECTNAQTGFYKCTEMYVHRFPPLLKVWLVLCFCCCFFFNLKDEILLWEIYVHVCGNCNIWQNFFRCM